MGSPWFALTVAVMNTIVVVINVKTDVGERINDAATARKGFEKLATRIEFFIGHTELSESPPDTLTLMAQLKIAVEYVTANLVYPVPMPSADDGLHGKETPGDLSSLLHDMATVLHHEDSLTESGGGTK